MASTTIYRKDYLPPSHWVDTVNLTFDLHPTQTHVTSVMTVRPNEKSTTTDLLLNGRDLELLSVKRNGKALTRTDYMIQPNGDMLIKNVDSPALIEVETLINPQTNTTLMGLYLSNGNFMTQCEAEGFRRITYYPDRPDVMAKFTVRINAPKNFCPVLLSNGNLKEEGELDAAWHYAVWEDPFPKPAYLFALVAGNLKIWSPSIF